MRYYALAEEARFYSNGGPCQRLLTDRLQQYLGGATHIMPVSNATVGLMAAVRGACGMRTDSRPVILTPAYTFTATAAAIEWPLRARVRRHRAPRLAPGPGLARGRVRALWRSGRRGARLCDVRHRAIRGAASAWRDLCDAHGVPLMIDSAPGFGTRDADGVLLGAEGDIEIFSFHATKPFSAGEGGIVATADPELAARIGRMINFGLEPGTRISADIGFNGKMSELHAAAALAMLDRIDDVVALRQGHARRLRAAIGPDAHLQFQADSATSTWQIFHVLTPTPEMRDRVLALAPEHGVEVRTMHDPALHTHPAYANCRRMPLPVTEAASARALALPMANELSDEAIARIAGLVHAAR